MSGVRPSAEIPAQTITEIGFWTLFTSRCSSGMVWIERDKILSFCLFRASSMVNNFSSEKTTLSRPTVVSLNEPFGSCEPLLPN